MRTDLLSKRIFSAGCFGLPWLWIVHVLYWRGNQEEANEGLLNPDDHFHDEPTEASTEEIKAEAAIWVGRCRIAATFFIMAWIGWIIAAQLLRGILPATWYMINPEDATLTGW